MSKIWRLDEKYARDLIPLPENVWFQAHQRLLLKMLATKEGRDLLCVSQDLPPIIDFRRNSVTCFLDEDGEGKTYLQTTLKVGCKYSNVISYRWPEFVALAKRFYDIKTNPPLTWVEIDGEWRLAATTTTLRPDPDSEPSPTTTDGRAQFFDAAGEPWATARGHAGTGASASEPSGVACNINADTTTDNYDAFNRGLFLFDAAVITGTKVSGKIRFKADDHAAFVVDELGGSGAISLVVSAPASNTTIAAGDYDSLGTTKFASDKTLASIVRDTYFEMDFNASGLSNVDGISPYGLRITRDNDDNEPTWASGEIQSVRVYYADQTGTAEDPECVVVWTGVGRLVNGGLAGNNGLVGGRLI